MVQYFEPEVAQARQFLLESRPQSAAAGLHRLLQSNDGKAVLIGRVESFTPRLKIEWRSGLCLPEIEITKLRNQSSSEQQSLLDQVVHQLQQADQCLQMVEASQNANPLKTAQKHSLRLLQGGKDDTNGNTPF